MEPLTFIFAYILIIGGFESISQTENVVKPVVHEEPSIISETPIFEHKRFYRSKYGYFISNLDSSDECDVYTKDLTDNAAEVECEVTK